MVEDSDSIVRSLGKSSLIIVFGVFLQIGVSFIAKVLVANSLPKTGYGEVAVGLVVLSALGLIARLGLDTGIARMSVRFDSAQKRGVLLSSYLVAAVFSLTLLAALFVAASPIADLLGNPALTPVLRIVAFGIPAIPMMRLSIGVVRAEGLSWPKVIVQNITDPVSRILLLAGIVTLGATPTEVIIAYVASYWLSALLALWYAVRYSPLGETDTEWTPMYREMLNFSVPLMASTGMTFIISNIDTLMVQYFTNSSSVAEYDIAFLIGQALTIVYGAVGYLFLPKISELEAEDKWLEIDRIYTLVTKWILFATFPAYLVLVFLPEPILRIAFGPEYVGGAPVLILIATAYFVRAGAGPNEGILSAAGHTRYIMTVNGLAAAINVVLNAVLIVHWGIVGAAVASFLTFTALNLLYNGRIYQLYRIQPLSRSMTKPLVGFTAYAVAVIAPLRFLSAGTVSWVLLSIIGALLTVGYAVAILGLGGLQSEDVMLINDAEQQLGIDLEPVKRYVRSLMR